MLLFKLLKRIIGIFCQELETPRCPEDAGITQEVPCWVQPMLPLAQTPASDRGSKITLVSLTLIISAAEFPYALSATSVLGL